MPALSAAYVAVMLVCSGGEGCDTIPVKGATPYVSKEDCTTALAALPVLRKTKYKCEQQTTYVRHLPKAVEPSDIATVP